MKLYQLCGADSEVCFSPYAWRAKLCLLHKGLTFEEVPVRFLEKDKIAHVAPQTIPVLDDGDTSIVDSFAIAEYLETNYPEPDLFGGPVASVQARFLNVWLDQTLVIGMVQLILMDIYQCLDPENKSYFRETREKRFGCSLEEMMEGRDEKRERFRKSLNPMRAILAKSPYLSGTSPRWFDYAVFGTFMWPHVVSPYALLAEDDSLYDWRERMFGLFGGEARRAKQAF